jgi:hypothetical protein
MHCRIPDYSRATVGFLFAGFELRLDQSDDLTQRFEQCNGRRDDFAQGDERAICNRQIDRLERLWKVTRRQSARIGFLHDDYACILPQLPRELTLTDIDGVNPNRAPLQEAIRKSTCGCAKIKRAPTSHIDFEKLERMLEFVTPTADEFFGCDEGQRVAWPDRIARFLGNLVIDADLSGEH